MSGVTVQLGNGVLLAGESMNNLVSDEVVLSNTEQRANLKLSRCRLARVLSWLFLGKCCTIQRMADLTR